MQDPKNKLKTTDQVKQIVAKNLGKDWNYYTKNAQFGIKGIGYTKEAPGLGEPKEPKGKWKSSGYGDLNFETEKVKANTKDTLGAGEAKTTMPKKVAVMSVAPQSSKGVGKMKLPGKPKTIKMQESYMDTLGGETPYGKSEMIKNIVEPNLGKGYKAYIMFDPEGEYESMKKKYASNTNNWKNLYRSSNYQGYADMSPDGNVIKATILDKGGVVGAIYVKDSMQESQIRSVIQQIIKEELNMKEIDNAGKRAEYEAKIKKIDEEILKRKKKIKALTTLEEIEKGSTNKDMMKSLKKELKTLEALKTKLNKKFTPEEEVIGEDSIEPLPLKY
jgi:hypothetical protein